jgi:hypothetical protein
VIRNFLNKLFSEIPEWDGAERRRSLRAKCEFQLEVDLGQQPCPARTLDVGASGVRIRLDLPWSAMLKKGQEATLRYPHPPFECEVASVGGKIRWIKSDGKGIIVAIGFNDNIETLRRSWVKHVLLENFKNGADQKRKDLRVHSQLPALLQLPGDTAELQANLRDLSIRGARLQLANPLAVGTELLVRFNAFSSHGPLTLRATVERSYPAEGSEGEEQLHELGLSFTPQHGKKTAMLKLFKAAVAQQRRSTL